MLFPTDGHPSERTDILAVLDVFEQEPMATDNELRSLKNVYPLPHRAGPTNDRYSYIGKAVVDDVIRFKNGECLEHEISASYASRMTKHS
jgi:(S)-sulfolactate dehydrogenase